jgi:hypothetical protein
MSVLVNIKDKKSGTTRKIKCTPVFGGGIVFKSEQMPPTRKAVNSSCLSGVIFTDGGKIVSAKVVNMLCSLHDGAITVDEKWDPGRFSWASTDKNQEVVIVCNDDMEWIVIALK